MEIPDTIHSFLKPLLLSQPVDEKQLPPNLSRQFASIINHFQNNRGNILLLTDASSAIFASAADLLAKLTGTKVYSVDLFAVASNHLGDTEKHLLQIFEFVEQHHLTLLFNEVDSLFNKRTNIRSDDEHYVNLDINYLLKRIEAYPGLVIFTTNAHDDLDDVLLLAALWQIDLSQTGSAKKLSFWQRLFNRS